MNNRKMSLFTKLPSKVKTGVLDVEQLIFQSVKSQKTILSTNRASRAPFEEPFENPFQN